MIKLFHEGLAQVEVREDAVGFIDKSGEFVKPLKFIEQRTEFSEGLAKVSKGDKFGYVDKTGRFVIEARFAEAEDFKEGLAAVRLEDTFESRYGFIDKTGKMVIDPQFNHAESFSEGLAAIDFGDKYGYIDKSGKVVIPPQFDHAFPSQRAWRKLPSGTKPDSSTPPAK
ncbi:MAG: WG repeat-containing protein [Pyrinomonadaceae bacterium]